MKKILSIIFATLFLAYIVFAAVMTHGDKEDKKCENMIVVIKDSTDRKFLTAQNITTMLRNAKLYPVGKNLSDINTQAIEEKIAESDLVSKVTAYKTPAGSIKIEISQKMPVLRVFSTRENYYVDDTGNTMPADYLYSTYLPVASGNIEKSFATTELYKFALFLQQNQFWNNQIEQIYVFPDKEVELIPRIGGHRIILGELEGFEEKLNKLQIFYEQAIPKVGWEKYEVINLKYKNQIVCTKK
ncbi:MAG: cell division protein FtsQ/DivIB [Tannerella sp.]|jgi:cell division protein FtsQ|nr:cell division protein FtsQ/DivIB [Tannerella sp.]